MAQNSFSENFEKLVFERCKTAGSIAINDPEYIKTSNEMAKLFHNIKELLGENDKLIWEYEYVVNANSAVLTEYAYKQGLRDGIALLQELGLFKMFNATPLNLNCDFSATT